MVWVLGRKGPSGFSARSTAEEVTQGVDGSGLFAIVTGASSGIGTETARVLALRRVHVFLAVRNIDDGQKVKEMIIKDNPSAKVDAMELDLASKSSVRKFASDNNAGVMMTPFILLHDGIELQFTTNHIGHFLLTDLLLEKMKPAAHESNTGWIVNVSSEGHRFSYKESFLFDKINDKSRYGSIGAYGQSKLANILHADELSRRLKEEGVQVTTNSLHPGSIVTNLVRYHSVIDSIARAVSTLALKSLQQVQLDLF